MSETNNSVAKTLEVLELFLDSAELTVAQIHEATGYSKSAINRIVSTCHDRRFLTKDQTTSSYRLGSLCYYLGRRTDLNREIVRWVSGPTEGLARALGLTVSISVLEEGRSVVVHQRRGDAVLGLVPSVGARRPLNCSAAGKVLVAFGDNPDGAVSGMEFTRFTSKTIMDPVAFRTELAKVHQAAIAVDDEELEDNLYCIAMPVRAPAEELVCSLSVSGPKPRMLADAEVILLRTREAVARIESAISGEDA